MKDEEDPAFKRMPIPEKLPETLTDPSGRPLPEDFALNMKSLTEGFMKPLPLRKLKKRNADDPNEPEEWGRSTQ